MFGEQPGAEVREGKLNQHVVTKLVSPKRTYWVLHTKGEDPVSVLITALTKQKIESVDLLRMVSLIHSKVPLNARVFNAVRETEVLTWGTSAPSVLGTLADKAVDSCVLAYEKADDVAATE